MTSAVFDGQITGQRLVLPLGGIAGWVATTGQPLNLPDVYQDPRFNKEVDLRTGYRTKSMLCMPVLGPSKKIVGVTNLINKKAFESDGKFTVFTREDEELLSAFSLICGLALHKNFLLAEISKKQKTLTLTMEIMSYHAIANAQEVSRYLSTPRLSVPIPDLRSLTFDPHVYSLTDDTLVTIVLDMFKDLGFDMLFGISESMLQPYVLTVRKNYRTNLPYHNFVHATSVTHSIYLMIKTLGVGEIITDPIELFALFVAALNHDVDHRGRSNAFEKNANSVLAAFYSTSTLERHHFHHAMTILQRDEYNLFRNLSPGEYSRALKSFEHAILSTDLAIYFGNLKRLKRLNVEEPFDPSNQEHLELFKGLIMTTSDLIGLTKNFHSSQKTADSVYTEFFLQGDEERRLGMPYSSRLTDRSQESFIPELQVDFLSHVVRPAFEVLRNVIPATGVLLQSVDENIGCWKRWVDAKKPYVIGQPFS
ncbi:hypothetical protein BJ742DRAFT_683179 [Cladochytrium replicatum]|nr:hypothetical protein BJ742DRAFT_683179 [Cladochytrium replicatum]